MVFSPKDMGPITSIPMVAGKPVCPRTVGLNYPTMYQPHRKVRWCWMVNRLNLIDLSISLYGTWVWRPDVNSNLSKSPFCWFWRLTSWFIPAKKLKSTWGADIIIYHVPSYIPTEMFFFVCHHHGKQVVKFGSKRVLVCSFYFSYPLPQMNVSRVLEANFIRRFENIMFFSHHFWTKNGVSYMPAFLWPDPVVLSQTTQTRQQFSTKKRLDWTSWQRFGAVL